MKKLSQVKKLLKKNNLWPPYKRKFSDRQMKLIFSKLLLVFNEDIPVSDLLELEKLYFNSSLSDQENMFESVATKFKKISDIEMNEKALGIFIFYVYQTSTYYKDIKKGVKNIFTEKNFVEKNAEKRRYYFQWIDSLKIQDKEFNLKVIKTLKVVF